MRKNTLMSSWVTGSSSLSYFTKAQEMAGMQQTFTECVITRVLIRMMKIVMTRVMTRVMMRAMKTLMARDLQSVSSKFRTITNVSEDSLVFNGHHLSMGNL